MLYVESFQNSFRNGPANLGFCTASEFIDQNQAAFIATLHHDLHVRQVGRVSAQVVFNGLFVAYIDEDAAEQTGVAAFVHGYQHTAL